MTTAIAAVTSRPYRDDLDWRRLNDLAVRIHRLTGRWRCWTPDRIDGFLRGCLYDDVVGGASGWRDRIHLWEAPSGELVGAVHHEGPEEAWLELDPAWTRLAPELLHWAEQAHRGRHAGETAPPPMQAYAVADDEERQALLAGRGYVDRGPTEVLHGRSLGPAAVERCVPSGYRLRRVDLDSAADREQLVRITRLAFPRAAYDERAIALESRMRTEHEYLVATTADGSFAAWCGAWASPGIGVGQFEPVGTHPDQRRRGLASAVMAHGLERMRRRGLRTAFVGTGVLNPSNGLYASLGFQVAELYHQWEWPA